jgi:hypothetical protein
MIMVCAVRMRGDCDTEPGKLRNGRHPEPTSEAFLKWTIASMKAPVGETHNDGRVSLRKIMSSLIAD